jgi:hypothetical protein
MNVWPVKNWLASLIATATSTVITRAIEKQLHCYGGKGFPWRHYARLGRRLPEPYFSDFHF